MTKSGKRRTNLRFRTFPIKMDSFPVIENKKFHSFIYFSQ